MPAVLTSWKEIAAHLGKSIRTVQRWERELGLPVRRPDTRRSGIVLADPTELDAWLHRQSTAGTPEQKPSGGSAEFEASYVRFTQLREYSHSACERVRALHEQLNSQVGKLGAAVQRQQRATEVLRALMARRGKAGPAAAPDGPSHAKGQPAA